jgi:short-subunit dehydrogenase
MKRHTEKKIRGVIINTVSTAGVLGDPRLACYSASKAGLANLTRAMAADHARDGIRVNAVAPGFTRTGMSTALVDDPELYQEYVSTFPMGRIGEAEELAAAMMFLASDDASFIAGVGGYRLANQFQYNCCELGFGYHKLTYQPVLNVDGGLLSVSGLPELNANPGVSHTHP